MNVTYSITFQTVTPESAEHGDFAEHGFLKEDIVIEPQDEETLAQAVARVIANELTAIVEPSSTNIDTHTWFTECDPDRDLETGAETYRSIHFDGLSAEDMKAAWSLLR